MDNIEKELELMEYKKNISDGEINIIREQLKKFSESENKKLELKANKLLRKIEKIQKENGKKNIDNINKNDNISEDSEDEEENIKGGTYNNYGFYKTTLDMIYGGADEDKVDLQKNLQKKNLKV